MHVHWCAKCWIQICASDAFPGKIVPVLKGLPPVCRFGFSLIAALGCCAAFGQTPDAKEPWPGLKLYSISKRSPVNKVYVAVIDLKRRKLRVRVSPAGKDPDGPGQWQTTLMPPTEVAARDGMDFVVNGDFFRIPKARDAEGAFSPYRAKMVASVIGPAVTDGKVWSTSKVRRPCLVIKRNGAASIEAISKPGPKDFQVISGNVDLLKVGEIVPHSNSARHPRTAVGLTEKGTKLVVVVVDGRKPGISEGMSYDELAEEMKELGCWDAINLDGGGSSVMAYRDKKGGEFTILNDPTDGHERPVANVLEVGPLKRSKPVKKARTKSKRKARLVPVATSEKP